MALAELTGAPSNRISVDKKSLETVLQQCQLALQQLACGRDDDVSGELDVCQSSAAHSRWDTETAELYGLLQSRLEHADLKKKLENAETLLPQNMAEEGSSWDMVGQKDLWGGGPVELETEDYVLVREEDIIEGIASFLPSYLVSLGQTKDLTTDQLQEALSKTFSTKKKGKLRKAWEGGKVIYNVVSWGATAIG